MCFKNGRLAAQLARIYDLMCWKKIQNPLLWVFLALLVGAGFATLFFSFPSRPARRPIVAMAANQEPAPQPRFESLREKARGQGKPNIIFILADDLGYGDLGCFGQKKVKTPNLDRMAAEGMRFTQAYAGTTVCAPSRAALMTGLHTGHSPIRGNKEIKPEGQQPMPANTFTLGHLMKGAGYVTGAIGKWGLGHPGSDSTPEKMGFDYFFGYNCQRLAHEYYPPSLWRGTNVIQLDGKTYSHDLM